MMFLKCLAKEPDAQIRRMLVSAIARLIRPGTYHHALNFARFALEQSKEQLASAIWLMKELNDIHPNDPSVKEGICGLADALAAAGLKTDDPELILDALHFAFEFNEMHVGQLTDNIKQFWTYAVQSIGKFFEIGGNPFCDLMSMLGGCAEEDYMFADVGELFPPVAALFLRDDVDEARLNALGMTLQDIMCSDPDYVRSQDAFGPILQRFVKMGMDSYIAEETLEMSEVDTIDRICQAFALQPGFLDSLWASLKPLLGDPRGQALAGLVMLHSFKENPQFFAGDDGSGLDSVMELIMELLNSPAPLNRSIGTAVIVEFVDVFFDSISDYIDRIEETLIALLKASPSVELVSAFEIVLDASGDTDDVFEEAYVLLKALVQARVDLFGVCGVKAIRTLVGHSEIQSLNAFDDVISMMQQIISTGKPEFLPMIDECVECISSLSTTAPEKFAPLVDGFLDTLSKLMNTDERSLKSCCVNAYGKLLLNFAPQMAPSAEPMLHLCYELSGCDKSLEIAQDAITQAETGATDEDLDAEPVPVVDLEVTGGALMLMASIVDYFPELLAKCLPQLLERIEQLSGSIIPQSRISAIRSIVFTVESMEKNGFKGPEEINKLCMCCQQTIERSTDVEEVGYCLYSLARTIETFGLEPIEEYLKVLIATIEAALTGSLKCMDGQEDNVIEAFGPLSDILEVIMKAAPAQCAQILGGVMEFVSSLTESQTPESRMFALSVMRTFTEVAQGVSPEIQAKVLSLALEMTQAEDGSSGFHTIKRFALNVPQLIEPHLAQILQIIDAKLTTTKKHMSKKQKKTIDNAVSCLSVIATQVMKDAFPLNDLVRKALAFMPACNDVGENPDIMNFFTWLLNKEGAVAELGKELLAVLVRFFLLQDSVLEKTGIESAQIETLKAVLKKLVSVVPNGLEVCQHLCQRKSQFARIQQVLGA